jgi:hypothetical protein
MVDNYPIPRRNDDFDLLNLAQASVERKITDVGNRETPGNQRQVEIVWPRLGGEAQDVSPENLASLQPGSRSGESNS